MGIHAAPNPIATISPADALFTRSQQRVLGVLFGRPDQSFYTTELIQAVGGGSGAVQRELARLEAADLIRSTRIGKQKHYQANRSAPMFAELRGLVLKTVGLADVLRSALAPLAKQIELAFIYGSIAKGSDHAGSDIDVMIVGNQLQYPMVIEQLAAAEQQLGRAVNPTLYGVDELRRKRSAGNAFLERVLQQPRLLLIGSDDALG